MRDRASVAAALALLSACAGNPHVVGAPELTVRDPLWKAAFFLDSAIAQHAAPGAVIAVSSHGHRWFYGTGRLGEDDPTRPDSLTLYDLASVTKVVALTTLAMYAVSEGKLELDAPLQRYVPTFQGPDKDRVTVRHLLTHTSGLPAWRPLYQLADSRAAAFALADTTPLDTLPGVRMVYSDIGIILLTQAIEGLYGKRIDSLFAARVARPLGLTSTSYLPAGERRGHIAPTELDTAWRHRMLVGEVHDENAARLDGVSGHAGLFSDALDMVRFGEFLLRARATLGEGDATSRSRAQLIPLAADGTPMAPVALPTALPDFLRRQEVVPGSSRALGWDTPTPNSTAGHLLSPESFGHTGFTGPSIWIDPTRDLVIVVLANRVHPTRANSKWGDLSVRGGVADRVVRGLEAPRVAQEEHDRRVGNAVGFGIVGSALGAIINADPDGGFLPPLPFAAIFGIMGAVGGWLGANN